MKQSLVASFDAVCDEYSADRVVADPDLNRRYIEECRKRGLKQPVAELNRLLLNLRKQGLLAGRKRSKRTHFPDEGDYRFASEMAVRFLERRDGISLDAIFCDPEKAKEFDELAGRLCHGYSSLQYRWAAFNLRKAKKLEPEILARVAPSVEVMTFPVDDTDLKSLPTSSGLYQFFTTDQSLYVGETENLRSRLKKHLDHSDNKGLARWMWEFGTCSLPLELHVLEDSTPTRIRRALERELINSRQPIFNIQR